MDNQNNRLAPIIKPESLAIYSPDNVSALLATVTTTEGALALADQLPSLAKLNGQFGAQKTAALIKLYLIEVTELVNLKRPLSEKQIEYIAGEVMRNYYTLTIADIHVIFKNIVSGTYGALYESMDVPKVLKIFQLYFDERCEICEYSNRSAVGDKHGNMTSERMTAYFDKLQKKINK